MKFKTIFAKMTVCSLMLTTLFGCGQASQTANGAQDTQSAQTTELTVFAAASMTETLNQIAEDYKTVDQNVSLTFNFASSGDLLSQIREGADCDVFISAAPKQMNALDGSLKDDADKNPDGLDELLDGTRIDLLENKVVRRATRRASSPLTSSLTSWGPVRYSSPSATAMFRSASTPGRSSRTTAWTSSRSRTQACSPTARTSRKSPRRSARAQ